MIDGMVIVDFPGFDDTNGSCISLGAELALKALIKTYNPKVLVLESITNDEGRFVNVAKLGSRLDRLVSNKENCLLGLSKYTIDSSYNMINRREAKKERLEALEQKRTLLTAMIKTLSELNMPEMLPTIQEAQQKLTQIEKEREQQLSLLEHPLPLPETEEKAVLRRKLEKKESEILKQIQLMKMMRFCDLEDAQGLSSRLETLKSLNPVCVNPKNQLNVYDRSLLYKRFKQNLMRKIKTISPSNLNQMNYNEFLESVLEFSLIRTICMKSKPEIVKFLHLPEIDPTLLKKYDENIIANCLEEYTDSLVITIDFSSITKLLESNKIKLPQEKIAEFNVKLDRLQNSIFPLNTQLNRFL